MSDPPAADRLVDEVDAALLELEPGGTPLSEAAKTMIHESVNAAPPMTERQCMRIGRLLRGCGGWAT